MNLKTEQLFLKKKRTCFPSRTRSSIRRGSETEAWQSWAGHSRLGCYRAEGLPHQHSPTELHI